MDSNEVRSSQNYIPFKEQQKPELFDDMNTPDSRTFTKSDVSNARLARLELLMERKNRLINSITNAKQSKLHCDRTAEDLDVMLRKKQEQIDQSNAEYKIKLDDFHHVRSQVHQISCRTANINKNIQHLMEENRDYQEILASRKSEYLERKEDLVEQLRYNQQVVRTLREDQLAEKDLLTDQFKFVDTKLHSHQLQVQQLDDSLAGKSQQCEEMGMLCEDLFKQVEPESL